MTRPAVVVIPTFNALPTLPACVERARGLAGVSDLTVVVADGGSTDGTLEWCAARSDVKLLRVGARGVARAVNAAVAAHPGHDVVRLHADVLIETPGWLGLLREAAASLPKAGVVGVKLVYSDDRIESIGRNFVTGIGASPRHANLRAFEPDGPAHGGAPREVDAAPGAFCYISREAWDAAGPLDENYAPLHGDDDDFCIAARHGGWKVYAHPGVKAVHVTDVWGPSTRLPLLDPDGHVLQTRKCKESIAADHSVYFEEKWGWNPFVPDLGKIRRLYGDTEICWRIGEPMRFAPRTWPPSVDVVLVTWNNRGVLQRCLESLAQTRYERIEVHVVDNGSRDGTPEMLESLRATYRFPLHVHALPVNTGVPVGYNWAIRQGSAELVARIDDDVVLPADWLAELVEEFRRRPYAGVVGPKILNDNAVRDVQCGPYRLFPSLYGHDQEPDLGQADYRARCVHVRGCCNVYRRDVLETVGLFDLRFSPSQVDDPDHHAALGAAGYEVLYNGRVGVVHMQTNGAARSYAAQSNLAANNVKLLGKWGEDVWRILDSAIDLSEEGRYLTDPTRAAAFERHLAPKSAFPRRNAKPRAVNVESACTAARFRAIASAPKGPLAPYFDDAVAFAVSLRRDGRVQEALTVLQSTLDLAPARADAMVEMAETLAAAGRSAPAARWLGLAEALCQGNQPILSRIAALRTRSDRPCLVVADRGREIGEGDVVPAALPTPRPGRGPRVLMLNTFERRTPGGDMVQVRKTAEHLERLGCYVDVRYAAVADPSGYDVVHVFNLWFPQQTLPQVKAIRVARPDVPIVLTPIYWDMAEKHWADGAVPNLFARSKSQAELRAGLAALADGSLVWNGQRRTDRQEPNFPGYEHYQRCILDLVDHLLPQSRLEIDNMEATLGRTLPFTIVRNAAEPAVFDRARPEPFVEKYGLRDFVLTVGLVENRKNQLMLLHALRDLDVPVLVVGRSYDRNYLRLCRRAASPRTVFIEHLTHTELASAMKAALVFALPSWLECASFAQIEAALAGCPLVVGDRTSEREYFGDNATYCNPADVQSIRAAVVSAIRNRDRDSVKRVMLRERFTRDCTWENAAIATLTGYRRAFEGRGLRWSFGGENESAHEPLVLAGT